MADDFNPYHVWLGIPPDEQPANHYRLLSLRLFESSADVIDNAADRQMAHLRTIQVGKNSELSQRLLNEVAAARVCLLDPKKRAAYDQQLRTKLPATPAAAPAVESGSAIQRQPPRRPGPLPTVAPAPASSLPIAAASPQPANDWDDLLNDPAAKSASHTAGKSSGANAAKASAAKRAAKNRNMSIGIAAAVLLIAAAGIGWLALNGSSSEGTLVFDWPSDERADTTVTVDDVPLPAPATGAWEYHGPAGSHHIVASRPAYKLDANVALASGQRQTVPADWKPKAMLALSWPLALRAGAELKIDGRTEPITHHEPLEVVVEPGRHNIQITRTGFAPIVMTATVAADGRELVAVTPPPTTGKLVFDWPADQRKDAELVVDGHGQTMPTGSDGAPIELTLDPGRHVVRITRTGFEPFKQTIDLVAGANESVKPTWTPERTVATTATETQAPVETPAEQPEKKLPIPPATEQEKIAKQLDDLYKSSHSGSKDPAKAQEIFDLAAKSSLTERYVLLVKGAELAAAAGDVNLSLQGVDSLDAEFEIDALEAKQKLLDKFVNAGKSEQVDAAIPIAEQLMDQAVAADRYALAIEFSMTASRAATKSKTPTRKEIDERLSRRRHDIRVLEPVFAAAKTAQETLAKDPADADANSNLGRWLCFYKNDWPAGLPLLAKGSDEKLKSLAEQELKAPTDAEQQAHLADASWDLAQKEVGTARDSIHLHAGEIYQGASPNLTSALRKAAIEKRLAEIADLKPIVATVANGSIGPGKSPGAIEFPLNQWVDVLRIVDTTRDRVDGTWARKGTELSCTPGFASRIELPVVVEGGYDLDVEFTRTSSDEPVAALLSVGPNKCMILLSGWKGGDSGLMDLDGRDAGNRQNPIAVRPGPLENGRRYRVLVGVRLLADNRARIDVSLDGKPYLPRWEGDLATLSENHLWLMRKPRRLGFGAYQCDVTFHSIRLRMVSGHASVDPAVAESLAPQPGAAMAVGGKTVGATAFPLNQWVDVLRSVDTTKNVVAGDWSRRGKEIDVGNSGAARLSIPVALEGSYDMDVAFTRLTGDGEIRIQIPVGSYSCDIEWGMQSRLSGLAEVSGYSIGDEHNPARAASRDLKNGRVYRLSAKVRMLAADRASIDVFLDGKPFLPHWEGAPSALSVNDTWRIPPMDHLGLGVWASQATFGVVRLRMISGHASLDGSIAEPAAGSSTKTTDVGTLTAGQGLDLLAKVDANRDSIEGRWERHGSTIVCNDSASGGDRRFLQLPTEIAEARYELRVEFSRDSGDDCFAVSFPVGDRGAEFILSDIGGKFSGLEKIDGHALDDPANPTARSPSTLENGRRYVVRIVVSVQRDTAKVNCFLDGDELVAWKGKVDSLDQSSAWKTALHRVGVGEWNSPSTIYGASVRELK
jgi:hypothetical protein